ncbi:MAG: GFA family protein [Labilithrix sp.]|nr:GFA family protein [Labilithrix sp.]MCW5835152.1 GFA family protein [Labilithrix sp.]
MSETKTYEGSCHCGNVRYKATVDLASVIACNCSMCGRSGTLLTFVTPDRFELVAGEGATTDYQFNKKAIHHLFCSTCGIKPYANGTAPDGKKMVAVNVRCLDGVDLSTLQVTSVDGRSF